MTEAEKLVAEKRANAQNNAANQPPQNSNDGFANPDIQGGLTKVSDAQYQRGLDVAKAIAEHSFMQGINDQINAYLDAPAISEETLGVVKNRFQSVAAKRLKPAAPVFALPAFWDTEESHA